MYIRNNYFEYYPPKVKICTRVPKKALSPTTPTFLR
jgi:hypothetical protein